MRKRMSEAGSSDITQQSPNRGRKSLVPHDGDRGARLTIPVQETLPPGCDPVDVCNVQSDGSSDKAEACYQRSVFSSFNHTRSLDFSEIDGTLHKRDRDAPGQNCIYILSGDHREEHYRLATYYRYPENAPVKPGDLAAAGMYFTGFKDRVKCFSCGMAAENWIFGDDGMDRQWHKTDCPLMNGVEFENVALPEPSFRTLLRQYKGMQTMIFSASGATSGISNQASVAASSREATDVTMSHQMSQVRLTETNPIYPKLTLANIVIPSHAERLRTANLMSEFERRKTFDKWPSYPAPYLVSDLAKEGFFYLGNLDRCQCFSCSGVLRNWAPSDRVREQHQKHFPQCRIVLGLDAGNIPMADSARHQADSEYNARMGQINFSCVEPPDPPTEEQRRLAEYFPCMNAINQHMQSLQRRIETFDHRWPKTRIRATVEQIAKAGFYFLGESDKTKCFYCNGGLQNWDPNDEPWTEHAKWFPGCEYVLRQKGVDFVRRLAEAHPNLNRPTIRNPVSYYDIPPSEVRRTSPAQSMETQTTSNPLANIDVDRVENDMGFTRSMIESASERRKNEGGVFANTEELVQYLLDHGDELTSNSTSGQANSLASPSTGQKREGERENITLIKKTRTSSPAASLDKHVLQERKTRFEGLVFQEKRAAFDGNVLQERRTRFERYVLQKIKDDFLRTCPPRKEDTFRRTSLPIMENKFLWAYSLRKEDSFRATCPTKMEDKFLRAYRPRKGMFRGTCPLRTEDTFRATCARKREDNFYGCILQERRTCLQGHVLQERRRCVDGNVL